MALQAIDAIRDAELSAQKEIETAQSDSRQAIQKAHETADAIIAEAEEKVCASVENASDRARKQAEEIKVSAHNSALLLSDELRKSSSEKQQIINERILQLIV